MKTIGLLSVVLMLYSGLTAGGTAQETPPVVISAVRMQKFRNRGHHPENNRRVTFRLSNKSKIPLLVHGFKYDGEFEPTGYLLAFDSDRSEWVYPTSKNRPIEWNEMAKESKATIRVRPGDSIKFTAEMSQLEVGRRFKRTVYVAWEKNQEPIEVKSEKFILR